MNELSRGSRAVPSRTPELYREVRAQLGAEAPSRAARTLGAVLGVTIFAVFAGAWWIDRHAPAPALPSRPGRGGRMPLPG